MEKRVKAIVFRRLTFADFSHINKSGSAYDKGGGQSYIDFPTKNVSLADWSFLLGEATGMAKDRPFWEVNMNSLGLDASILLKIYNRRSASVCITAQKLDSSKSNRVPAWHPKYGFPRTDYDANNLNLVIYIVKTYDDDLWAGWFLKKDKPKNWFINAQLERLFEDDSAGFIKIKGKLFIDTDNSEWAFYRNPNDIKHQKLDEKDIEEDALYEDISEKLGVLMPTKPEEIKFVERVLKIRKRNTQIVKQLKQLYGNKCQLTGEAFTFEKKNGDLYSEVHHLIPLGEAGSDNYANMVVISPLIHRMLHYATVSPIDLSQIKNNELPITINGKGFTITWHREHSKIIEQTLDNESVIIDDEDE
jgi:5-methylcytosine-specific restriction enzyme A